jgi:SAM-dependent methyltransferase
MASSTWQVWPDTQGPDLFRDARRAAIPGAEEQVRVLTQLASHTVGTDLAVLDLGCGDAVLLHALMRELPIRLGVALDRSPAMLERAQIRFEELGLLGGLLHFVEADFGEPGWMESLPFRQFDVVVAGYALADFGAARLCRLFEDVFALLRAGGLFVVLDHLPSGRALSRRLLREAWQQSILSEPCATKDGVEGERPDKEVPADPALQPPTAEEVVSCLGRAGFSEVDCCWKIYDLALVAALRP